MARIQLSVGTVDYQDTGGSGSPIVLLHGVLMDASLWDPPVAAPSADYRCIAPTLPMGAHRIPVHTDADLSLSGLADLAVELIDGLGLRNVTLVGSDTGGALAQLIMARGAGETAGGGAGVARVILVSCEAFDNIPARLTGTTLALAGRLSPALFLLFVQQLRLRAVRRLPVAFGWLTARGDAATARWIRPVVEQPAIPRDTVRVLRAMRVARKELLDAAALLHEYTNPVLVVWARQDRVMPPRHGRRLADLLPHGRLVEVDDTRTLISLDQPGELGRLIGEFIRSSQDI